MAPSVAFFGAGAGLSLPAVMTLAMSAASPEAAGQASGLLNTSQQVGGALGLAIVATLAVGRTDTAVRRGADPREALVEGYQLAWTIGAGWVLAAAGLAALALVAPWGARGADATGGPAAAALQGTRRTDALCERRAAVPQGARRTDAPPEPPSAACRP